MSCARPSSGWTSSGWRTSPGAPSSCWYAPCSSWARWSPRCATPASASWSAQDKPILAPFLGFTESTVVLIAVDLLFALFVFIQFRYLFGGQANITPVGYTYSEYARRGFGELVAVAFLSLGLILGLGAYTPPCGPRAAGLVPRAQRGDGGAWWA